MNHISTETLSTELMITTTVKKKRKVIFIENVSPHSGHKEMMTYLEEDTGTTFISSLCTASYFSNNSKMLFFLLNSCCLFRSLVYPVYCCEYH